MLPFSKTLKLYVFKDKDLADLTLRVNDCYAQTYPIPLSSMKEILAQWKEPNGFTGNINGTFWCVQLKHHSPRPVQTPASYVRISIYHGGCGHQFRVDADDMLALEKDFFYQINNHMYWDPQ